MTVVGYRYLRLDLLGHDLTSAPDHSAFGNTGITGSGITGAESEGFVITATAPFRAAGVTEMVLDWVPSRPAYQRWRQTGAAPGQTLLLHQLADLGETVPAIHAEIEYWQQAGLSLKLLSPVSWSTALAQIPHDLQSRQIAWGQAQRRLKQLPPPGKAPFGYRRDRHQFQPDRRGALIVRAFFDHFLLYGSVRGAVRHIARTYGKSISVATGRRWLGQPVYRGDLAYCTGLVVRDQHPPILNREEAAQIDRWLRRNRTLAPRAASAPRSLSGLVQCADCGQTLRFGQVKKKNRTYQYLRCPACRHSWPYQEVLDQLIQNICQALPQRVQGFDPLPLQALQQTLAAEISKTETILHDLPQYLASGVLDLTTFEIRQLQLKGAIATLQDRREHLPPANLLEFAQTAAIAPFWQDLTEPERRAYFRELLQSVTLSPDGSLAIKFSFDPHS